MFAENPSPLPDDATTDAMVDLRHFHSCKGSKKMEVTKREKESPYVVQAQFLVTFRLSTERNVKRLVGAAAAQVQLLKTMGLGRLTSSVRGPRCGRVEPTSRRGQWKV
jgi:hypothetical protein